MSGRVIGHIKDYHTCYPGWHVENRAKSTDFITQPAGNYPVDERLPRGTVWQCDDCQKVWIRDVPRVPGEMDHGWRLETRRERRKRLKRVASDIPRRMT